MKLLLLVFLAIASCAIAKDIQCIPLASFKLDCNTCYCSKRGEIEWCTLLSCGKYEGIITYLDNPKISKLAIEETCKPGSSFRRYCNSCKCLDGKSAACTRMACDKDTWNPDGTLKMTKNNILDIVAGKV